MSDRMYLSDDEGGNGGITMAGFLIGAVVGAGLALLLAPAPGGETRRKVGETAKKIGSRAKDMVNRGGEGDEGESFRGSQGGERFRGGEQSNVGQSSERSMGGQAGEPYRSGGRREPLSGGRTPQPGTPGTQS